MIEQWNQSSGSNVILRRARPGLALPWGDVAFPPALFLPLPFLLLLRASVLSCRTTQPLRHPRYSPVKAIGAIASHQLWSIGAVALPQLPTLLPVHVPLPTLDRLTIRPRGRSWGMEREG